MALREVASGSASTSAAHRTVWLPTEACTQVRGATSGRVPKFGAGDPEEAVHVASLRAEKSRRMISAQPEIRGLNGWVNNSIEKIAFKLFATLSLRIDGNHDRSDITADGLIV